MFQLCVLPVAILAWGIEIRFSQWLDGAELIERLLAPGPGALIAIPAALVFYVLRLGLVFLGPGIALASVVLIAVAAWSRRSERIALRSRARAERPPQSA